jgi:DNA-binding transcriptional ArsR family regulator
MSMVAAPRRQLDTRALIALAHPLRVQLRNELRIAGPATASQLARRFGESSGATSYHLRMLARHGFIEPEDGRGTARERWWRAVPAQLMLKDELAGDGPAANEALRLVKDEFRRMAIRHLDAWLEGRDRWNEGWREAGENAIYIAHLDHDEAKALRAELDAVLGVYARRPERPGSRVVEIQLNLFPTGKPE